MKRHLDRRTFLRLAAAAGVGAMIPFEDRIAMAAQATSAPTPAPAQMARFPEKTDLILLTDRPPNLETPIGYFRHDLTPNDAFFVRWHLSAVPTSVDVPKFRLNIKGHVDNPLSLSLAELKKNFEPVSLIAVAQCAGNSRSFFAPRVMGAQWGNGGIGNARWTGVRLKELLVQAGIRPGAVDVSFAGFDEPPLADTPKFVKALEAKKALDEEIIVAYAMNDRDLPMLNGFPLRLIVPGWYATYWVKSLNQITVLAEKFKGFWMDKAYRIPNNPGATESPAQLATDTVPISAFSVRSIFVRPEPAERIVAGKEISIEGLALDGGKGIASVHVSSDGGTSWSAAQLDKEIGKYSWRRFHLPWTPPARGGYRLMARATNAAAQTQSTTMWNRSGYQRNVIDALDVNVV